MTTTPIADSDDGDLLPASVNEHGDLVCPAPSCGAQIITPDRFDVAPGVGRCPMCRREFIVTVEAACRANRYAARSAERERLHTQERKRGT